MGLNFFLLVALFLPQFIIVNYFNKKNIQNTGKDRGSRNTASVSLALLFGIFTTITCPPILLQQYSLGGVNTFETDLIIHVAISFFLAHTAFVLVAKKINSELIHHVICLAALFYSLITQTFGQDLVMTIFLGEVSFFIYLKLIAKNHKIMKLEHLFEDLFVLTLTPLRIIVMPVYLYYFVFNHNTVALVNLLATAYILSGVYFNIKVIKSWRNRPVRIQHPNNFFQKNK